MRFLLNNVYNFGKHPLINNLKKRVIGESKPVLLGRWNYVNPEIKANYANIDNCGDLICGNPQILNETYRKNK